MLIVATWKVFLVSSGIVGAIIYNHLSVSESQLKELDIEITIDE